MTELKFCRMKTLHSMIPTCFCAQTIKNSTFGKSFDESLPEAPHHDQFMVSLNRHHGCSPGGEASSSEKFPPQASGSVPDSMPPQAYCSSWLDSSWPPSS